MGKVEFLDMYPLSFSEFLETANKQLFKAFHYYLNLDTIDVIPKPIYDPLNEAFKEYLFVGAMPEVAADFLETRNMENAQKIQDQILRAYQLDFVKHADKTTSTKIQQVWNSIPSQLARENKKFVYKLVKSGARARAYEEAIQWLVEAGLINKASRVNKIGIPLKAFEDVSAFKLFVFETGLLMRLANLDPTSFLKGHQFFTEFKGAIAENYVSHSLKKIYGRSAYYWTSEGKAEVDFVVEQTGNIIPIEVKSGKETKAKSLTIYKDLFKPKLRIRISALNLKLTDDLLNIPLFYSEHVDELVDKVLKH